MGSLNPGACCGVVRKKGGRVRQRSLGRGREEGLPRPRARQSFSAGAEGARLQGLPVIPWEEEKEERPRCSPGWTATHSLVQEGHEDHDRSVPVRNRAEGLWMIPGPWM